MLREGKNAKQGKSRNGKGSYSIKSGSQDTPHNLVEI